MNIKVSKFGGTSLADASQFRKVKAIVQADPQRRYIVPSAPGVRSKGDRKITDLLYLCHAHARQSIPFKDVFALIAERYRGIVAELNLRLDIDSQLHTIERDIASNPSPDYAASRGEYLSALILSELLGFNFVDAAEVILFDSRGSLDLEHSRKALHTRLADAQHAVIPGFYGRPIDGDVKTFSRGGSDVSGAVIAMGVNASVYENWTDVSGLLMADPRIVDNPRVIDTLTYRELRELAYMGATVLHDEAIFPVRTAGIPVNIRNTNRHDVTTSRVG
jgi:aspartate kinase